MDGFKLEVANYYGRLEVKKESGSFFWGLDNHDECGWWEIPKHLYDALVKHRKEIVKRKENVWDKH